jgi:hypothetical protein
MKVGDVEYQGDKRKATFYYTADGRVDFRELIRHYAKEFRVKIEMRQIGARQESAIIGGIGSCGRELCCSTWLTDFKSVSTAAARYQNLAINQVKLSGQCGRLKCCLNYELDTYLDALADFPSGADRLTTKKGTATLIKTDIFKKLLFYVYDHERGRGTVYPLDLSKVKEIQEMNARGEKPDEFDVAATTNFVPEEDGFVDVTGEIELPDDKKRRKKKKKKRPQDRGGEGDGQARNENRNDPRNENRNDPRPKPPGGPNPGQGQGRPENRRPDGQRGNQQQPRSNNNPNPQAPKGNNPQAPRPTDPNNRGGGNGSGGNNGGGNNPGRPNPNPNPRPPQPPREPQNRPKPDNPDVPPVVNNDATGTSDNPTQGGGDNRRRKNNRNKRRR